MCDVCNMQEFDRDLDALNYDVLDIAKALQGNMVVTRVLVKRIKQLEQEVEDLRATLEVKGDKELCDVIKSTDENTELYDEKDLKW